MWCLGTWFYGGLGSAGSATGLDDLKGFFNQNNSVVVWLQRAEKPSISPFCCWLCDLKAAQSPEAPSLPILSWHSSVHVYWSAYQTEFGSAQGWGSFTAWWGVFWLWLHITDWRKVSYLLCYLIHFWSLVSYFNILCIPPDPSFGSSLNQI